MIMRRGGIVAPGVTKDTGGAPDTIVPRGTGPSDGMGITGGAKPFLPAENTCHVSVSMA